MVSAKAFAIAALTSVAAAAPAPNSLNPRNLLCMSSSQAQTVATNFGTLIASYSKDLADKVLASSFVDYSESVNSLINTCPQPGASQVVLTDPTFASKAAFESGQGSQPAINFQQLNIWPGCKSVSFRWETTNTGSKPVIGIITAEVVPQFSFKNPWLISAIYSEFDSAAWVQNLEEQGVCPSGTV